MSFSLIRYEGFRGFERVQGVGLKVKSLLYMFSIEYYKVRHYIQINYFCEVFDKIRFKFSKFNTVLN